jgi:hypothetical protein
LAPRRKTGEGERRGEENDDIDNNEDDQRK